MDRKEEKKGRKGGFWGIIIKHDRVRDERER